MVFQLTKRGDNGGFNDWSTSPTTGVSRKAIRLYEELILPSIKRSEGNYRVYNQEHVFCINGIKQLRSLGVSLEEMKDLIVIFEKYGGDRTASTTFVKR